MRSGMWVLKCVLFVVVMVVAVGLLTQMLWNWLVPVLFAGPVITFAQTLGLLVLSKIFLWTFGKHHHGGQHRGGPWKQYWRQKMSTMNPEERDELKKKMRERWCRTDENKSEPN